MRATLCMTLTVCATAAGCAGRDVPEETVLGDAGITQDGGVADAGESDGGPLPGDDAGNAPRPLTVNAGADLVVDAATLVEIAWEASGEAPFELSAQIVRAPAGSSLVPGAIPTTALEPVRLAVDVAGEYVVRLSVVGGPERSFATDDVAIRARGPLAANPLPFHVLDAAFDAEADRLFLVADDGARVVVIHVPTLSAFDIELEEPARAVAIPRERDALVVAGVGFLEVRRLANGELVRRVALPFEARDVEVARRRALVTTSDAESTTIVVDIESGEGRAFFGPRSATIAVDPVRERAYLAGENGVARVEVAGYGVAVSSTAAPASCGQVWVRGARGVSRCGDSLVTSEYTSADLARAHALSLEGATDRVRDVAFDPLEGRIATLFGANGGFAARPLVRFLMGDFDELVDDVPVPGDPRRVFFHRDGAQVHVLTTALDEGDWSLLTLDAPERHVVLPPFSVTRRPLDGELPYDIAGAARAGDRIAVISRAPRAILVLDPEAGELLEISLPLEPLAIAADGARVASGHDGKLFTFDVDSGALLADIDVGVAVQSMVIHGHGAFLLPGPRFVSGLTRVDFNDNEVGGVELGERLDALVVHPDGNRLYAGTSGVNGRLFRFVLAGLSLAVAGQREDSSCAGLFADEAHLISRCGTVYSASGGADDLSPLAEIADQTGLDHLDARGSRWVVSPARVTSTLPDTEPLLFYDSPTSSPVLVDVPEQDVDGAPTSMRPRFAFFSADGATVRVIAQPRSDVIVPGGTPSVQGSAWRLVELPVP